MLQRQWAADYAVAEVPRRNMLDGVPGSESPPILTRYLFIARRRKWLILGILAAALAVGMLITLLATPQYTATTQIEISREQKNITNVQGVEADAAAQDLEFYSTQYALLEARSLAEGVVERLRLASSDAFFEAHGVELGEGLLTEAASGPLTREELQEREQHAVALLREHVRILPLRGSSLVDITYTSASPALSAQIANAWAEQFVDESIERKFESTRDAREFLEGRLAELRERLDVSERAAVTYASQKDILALSRVEGPDGRTRVDRTLASSNLEALIRALADATEQRIAAQSRASQALAGRNRAEVLGNQAIGSLRQRHAELASEYQRMLVQFEPNYPPARAMAEQLNSLEQSIAREEARLRGGAATELREAQEHEEELRQQVEQARERLDQQQRDSIQYNIYQRDADTNRELYDGLLQRYKEIGVAGVGASNIALIDRAQVPDSPTSPNLPLNLTLALMIGLFLAGGATFAAEQIDEGVRDPSQVPALLQAPLLGTVPEVEGDRLDAMTDRKSAISEAYFSIASNLAFSTDHGMPATMMVTSTRPGEGKSTSSWALASVLARTQKRVLLIDADMRSPSVHEFAGSTNEAGLSNLLAGADDYRSLLRTHEIGFNYLTAGPPPPSAPELLSSDRLFMLLAQMGQQFDHIIIDSPPVLGLADAPLISSRVEGILFIIGANGVAARGALSAVNRLRAASAHVLGAVVTKIRMQDASYGYGYGHDYGYGLEYGAPEKDV